MKVNFFTIAFISILTTICAQPPRLTEQDVNLLEKKAYLMMESLDEKFSALANSEEPLPDKERFIKTTLHDFFTEECTVEVENKRGKREYPAGVYLRNVLNVDYIKKFRVADIEFIDVNIDNLAPHPTKPGTYITTGGFTQIFSIPSKFEIGKEGLRRMVKLDETYKTFTLRIEPKQTPEGFIWTIRIVNIKVKWVKFNR
jgi:hypothetical protein